MTAAALVVALLALVPRANPKLAKRIAPVLVLEAERGGVPVELLAALAWHESGWNPWARNPATDTRGLLQLAPVHWQAMRPQQSSWSPSSNARAGARILRGYLAECGGDEMGAVARYHGRKTCVPDAWAREVVLMSRMLKRAAEVKS